jgi:hypothetical protein
MRNQLSFEEPGDNESVCSLEKSRAETVFEQYLADRDTSWEYEALPGRKKPDYLIPHAKGKCIVEVKEVEDPDPRPTSGFDPDRAVRAKIRRARKQFREYKHLPCGFAVYSESMFGPYDPSIMLAAAFGPGYQQAGRDYGRVDPNPSFYRFLKRSELPADKHFLAEPLLSPVANTTFSAMIMIARWELSELNLEVWKRMYAQQEAGQPIDNQFDLLNELGPTLCDSRRFPGTVRVIVMENCHKRLPFPDDLFRGPFDQRWAWNDGWCGPVWIGDKLSELYKQESVPFSML